MALNYISSVPKLVGRENYEWYFVVENVFVLEGLSNCLSGSENDTVLIEKAKAKLILTIDPSLYVHVKDADTCKAARDKIKILYEDTGVTRKIGLLRTLISLRLDNCDSMESYVNQITETEEFVVPGKKAVLKLHKAIYGLKQSSRERVEAVLSNQSMSHAFFRKEIRMVA